MPRKATGAPNGRPKKVPITTIEQLITAMALANCPKVEIASKLGISIDTFDRREGFAELYTAGRLLCKSRLRQKLIEMAMDGNAQVMIHVSKAILRNTETSALELSGPDGNPIEINTSDARQRLTALLARSAARDGEGDLPSVTH